VKQFFLTDPQTGHSTEPLLSGLYLKTMAIDNFGGKWIVPSQHGIYHISTDNSAILEHFTAENSPLPSNNVLSVAVAGDLVFIGTDRGIVSFAAAKNGSKPAHSVNDIYPLSVSLNDNIPVTISSLVPNSLLRITDRYGNSVFDTLTDAGSYVWNLSDMLGNKVKPDIYYIYGTQNGKTGLLGSVVISSMTD
jgi:hypothetical protein